MKHSVLLIKSVNDDSNNSCCSGEGEPDNGESLDFKNFYDEVKDNYRERVDLHVLDPRNSFLIFILFKDCFRFKVPFLTTLKTIFTYSVPSVIINGEVVFKTIPPSEDFQSYIKTLTK